MRRYFEDIEVGDCQESSPRSITTDEIVEFASKYDPQYFHADREAAAGSVFGEPVASGIHTLAIWRQLDHEIAHDIAWICGVAWDEVRWPRAVRGGDVLRARAECISKRESRSEPRRGVVVFLYTLLDAGDNVVFTCKSTNLVERRPAT